MPQSNSIQLFIVDCNICYIKRILESLNKQISYNINIVVFGHEHDLGFQFAKMFRRKTAKSLDCICIDSFKDIKTTILKSSISCKSINALVDNSNYKIFSNDELLCAKAMKRAKYSTDSLIEISSCKFYRDLSFLEDLASNGNEKCNINEENKNVKHVELAQPLKNQVQQSNPFFSVVVTSYNYAQFIGQTLNSIVGQTFRDFEVVVVDDGSTDNSISVVDSYARKFNFIHLIQHDDKKNHGLAQSVKLAVLKSKGKYISFCESDDYWTIDHLQKIYDLIKRNDERPLIVSNALKAFGDDYIQVASAQQANEHRMNIFKDECNEFDARNFQNGNFILTFSCCTVRRDALLKCSFSSPKDALIDWWLWTQIAKQDNFIYAQHDVLTYWRQHQSYLKKRENKFSTGMPFLYGINTIAKQNEKFNIEEKNIIKHNFIKWFRFQKKTNNRVAIFAMHNNANKIDDATIYYLKSLKEVVDNIVVVSDAIINDDELQKLNGIAYCCIFQPHDEYDFGSYKRGFMVFMSRKELFEDNEQLVFCNDSCYGPIVSFKQLFNNAQLSKHDMFGITSNCEFHYHIQSYFFVLNRKAYSSFQFMSFMNNIQHHDKVLDVIKNYELNLTKIIQNAGFKAIAYSDLFVQTKDIKNLNPSKFPYTLLKIDIPLLKKKLFFESRFSNESRYDALKTIKSKNANLYSLIKNEILNKTMTFKQIEHPMISIVVASYNYEKYIRKTIDSLIAQTYKNFEVVVIDDGSTDNSMNILNNYAKQYDFVKIFQHHDKKNHGLADTVKLGIQKSNGDYIVFCESDDYLRKDYLEEKMKMLIENDFSPNIIINDIKVVGNNVSYDIQSVVKNRKLRFSNTMNDVGINAFKKENLICTFSIVMINKKMFENVNYDTPFMPNLDWWLWNQIIKKDHIIYFVDKKLTYWRSHKDSQMAKQKQVNSSDIMQTFLSKLQDL